jgi:hypothetical protein
MLVGRKLHYLPDLYFFGSKLPYSLSELLRYFRSGWKPVRKNDHPMKLVSAAFIVTVHKNDMGPNLVLFPGLLLSKRS